MQTTHGVPLPIYRGFQLLAAAGDEVLPVAGFNQSGPLTIMATKNSSTNALVIFLANFAPDDNKPADALSVAADADDGDGLCYKMRPNPCTEVRPNTI